MISMSEFERLEKAVELLKAVYAKRSGGGSAVIITEAEAASVRDADTVDRELQKMDIE